MTPFEEFQHESDARLAEVLAQHPEPCANCGEGWEHHDQSNDHECPMRWTYRAASRPAPDTRTEVEPVRVVRMHDDSTIEVRHFAAPERGTIDDAPRDPSAEQSASHPLSDDGERGVSARPASRPAPDTRTEALREALSLAEWRARDYDDLATAYNILTDAIRAALSPSKGSDPARFCGSCGTPDHYAGDRTHPCRPPRGSDPA